jgi:hypothetical protein
MAKIGPTGPLFQRFLSILNPTSQLSQENQVRWKCLREVLIINSGILGMQKVQDGRIGRLSLVQICIRIPISQ